MHHLFNGLENILQALDGYEVRAVGGAVRAVLRHDPLADIEIDLATPATPEQVLSACLSAKLATTTPGLRWGTVTVHLAGRPYEVTSLRQDSYVGGSRYPTVSFTQNWSLDAARRDFTINAVYLSPDGTLYDPYGGEQDLKNGLVRFIGEPATRLREDPLRLLRFFRFCGHYGLGGLIPEVVEAFHQAAPALATLSRTRVQKEWSRLLQTPQAATITAEVARLGLMDAIQARLS
ncbi:MAG: hypothetical protein GC129_03915 [Proteobacteria bacterium]|nr:hypothetical protein [Pseudomonadota bacterium]